MENRYEDIKNKIVCEIWRWPSVINSLVRGFNKLGYAPPTWAHIGFKRGGEGKELLNLKKKNKKYKLGRPSTTTNQETKKPATPPFQVTLYNIPDVADIHVAPPVV